MKNITRVLAMILLTILMLGSGLSALSALAEVILVTEKAKAYQLPSSSAKSITVAAGTMLEMTAQQNGWVRVEKDGHTAYMKQEAIARVVDCNEAAGYVTEAAPMYRSYGSSSQYGTLPVGTEVTVVAMAGEWCYVRYKSYKGYVRKDCLSAQKPNSRGEADALDPEDTAGKEDRSEVVITKGKYAYAAVEDAKVYKSFSTTSKLLGTLPVNTRLSVEAVRDDWAFVSLNGFYGFMQLSALSSEKVEVRSEPTISPSEDAADQGGSVSEQKPESADLGKSSTQPAKGTAQEADWWESDIQEVFARGVTATITDVATGIAWKEIRKGGSSHADVQPLTAADAAAMKAAVGKWSWDRRAVYVTINGVNYAASMNCMPHGSGSINNNNFNGHHCIHFTNSRGHSSNKVCQLHKAAIQKALAAKL